ncbi:hypothetical protein ACN9MY_22230 [Pseudoduganella sp. R-31]|uniref:hypothetical protein n=1 Tax=unclassified Pseudoduganella TaxID=2637179 RepID=UPI003CED036D
MRALVTPEWGAQPTKLPPELDRYFPVLNGDYSERWDIGINLLDRVHAEKCTCAIASHPVVRVLNGIVLDDPNTSDHHIYLNHPALKGSVLFLSHDGDSRVVFASLAEFMDFVGKAKREGLWFSDLHPSRSTIVEDQVALSQLITDLLDNSDPEIEAAVLAIIPSMDLRDERLLSRLASDSNFFYGEAVAREIEKRPAPYLMRLAERCAQHEHIQVRQAWNRAVAAIRELKVES